MFAGKEFRMSVKDGKVSKRDESKGWQEIKYSKEFSTANN